MRSDKCTSTRTTLLCRAFLSLPNFFAQRQTIRSPQHVRESISQLPFGGRAHCAKLTCSHSSPRALSIARQQLLALFCPHFAFSAGHTSRSGTCLMMAAAPPSPSLNEGERKFIAPSRQLVWEKFLPVAGSDLSRNTRASVPAFSLRESLKIFLSALLQNALVRWTRPSMPCACHARRRIVAGLACICRARWMIVKFHVLFAHGTLRLPPASSFRMRWAPGTKAQRRFIDTLTYINLSTFFISHLGFLHQLW